MSLTSMVDALAARVRDEFNAVRSEIAALPTSGGGDAPYLPAAPDLYVNAAGAGLGPEITYGTGLLSLYYMPTWRAPSAFRIIAARIHISAAGNGVPKMRLGLARMGVDDQPEALVADWGEVAVVSNTVITVTGLSTVVEEGVDYSFLVLRSSGFSSMSWLGYPVPYGSLGQSLTVPNRNIHARYTNLATATEFPATLPDWDTLQTPGTNSAMGPLESITVKKEPL